MIRLRDLPQECLRLTLIALALWPIILLCGCERSGIYIDNPPYPPEPASAPHDPAWVTPPEWRS